MATLETSLHLSQPPRYRAEFSPWSNDFLSAIPDNDLTWDIAGILSLTSFGYACGNRTLLAQISRQPWLSHADDFAPVRLSQAPPHGLRWAKPKDIAGELLCRLEDELAVACSGRKSIFILLSGGLDSRIVAGVMARLLEQGRITTIPTAVTWGIEGSRDVLYAKAVADRLHFNWQYVTFENSDFLENVQLAATKLGALSAPTHLHRMAWFKHAAHDSLVIAGSYGDSVGRGEFSGSSVLELRPLQPFNINGLLQPEIASHAARELQSDLNALKARICASRTYAFLEIEQQAQYMRGMIAHSMSIINSYCTLYQAFTAPEVYGHMWSLHPSARTDDVYVELIRMLGNELIAIPWARTNLPIDKSVAPIVHYAKAAPDYRPYKSWMAGPLRDQVGEVLDPKWFAETGLFIDSAVSSLRQNVMTPTSGTGPQAYPLYHLAGWLWSFRHFAEHVLPHAPKLNKHDIEPLRTLPASATIGNTDKRSAIRRRLADVRILLKSVRRVRKWWLRHEAIKRYPPE